MTLKAVTYYQVVCDELGCKAQPDDEYSAWAQADYALEQAVEERGWSSDDEGHHWCPDHRPAPCPTGEHHRNYPDDCCKKCRQWPEDDGDE